MTYSCGPVQLPVLFARAALHPFRHETVPDEDGAGAGAGPSVRPYAAAATASTNRVNRRVLAMFLRAMKQRLDDLVHDPVKDPADLRALFLMRTGSGKVSLAQDVWKARVRHSKRKRT